MTKSLHVIVLATAMALTFSACSKNDEATMGVAVSAIDTSEAQKQFKGADDNLRTDFDSAILSVRSGSYTDAMERLKYLAMNPKLTPEQQQAIKDLMTKVQQEMQTGGGRPAGPR